MQAGRHARLIEVAWTLKETERCMYCTYFDLQAALQRWHFALSESIDRHLCIILPGSTGCPTWFRPWCNRWGRRGICAGRECDDHEAQVHRCSCQPRAWNLFKHVCEWHSIKHNVALLRITVHTRIVHDFSCMYHGFQWTCLLGKNAFKNQGLLWL